MTGQHLLPCHQTTLVFSLDQEWADVIDLFELCRIVLSQQHHSPFYISSTSLIPTPLANSTSCPHYLSERIDLSHIQSQSLAHPISFLSLPFSECPLVILVCDTMTLSLVFLLLKPLILLCLMLHASCASCVFIF